MSGVRNSWGDVREERRLRPVQISQLLGPLLLSSIAARAAHARDDVARDQLDEAAVAVVELAVPVQPRHQESHRFPALLQQRHHEGLRGRRRPGAGRQIVRFAVQVDQLGHALRQYLGGPVGTAPGRQYLGRRGMPGLDSADPGQQRVTALAEQIGRRKGQVVRIVRELPGGVVEHLALGAYDAEVRTQVAQRCHAARGDHSIGVFADHAQHPDDAGVVVAQRTVGEGVIRLLGVSRPLDDQQQTLVPGGLPGLQHARDPRTDVSPDLGPHLAGRAAQRPGVLAAQGVSAVGGIAEERQLGAPCHPHRKPRRQQDVDSRTEALWPVLHRPERGGRPVDGCQVKSDLLVCPENHCPSLPKCAQTLCRCP